GSDAALFGRTAAVVGDGSDVADNGEIEPDGLESADGGFAASAGTRDDDFDFLEAVTHGLAGRVLRDHLGGVGGTFARAFKPDFAGARPSHHVSFDVGDRYGGGDET